MKVNILKKDKVLSCGGGDYRTILDQDAKIAYAYNDPTKIVAVYESSLKSWVVHNCPNYSTGGWGARSSGDAIGYHTANNARAILNALGVQYRKVTSDKFLTNKEVNQFNRDVAAYNLKADKLNEQVKKLEGKDSYNLVDKRKPIELKQLSGGSSGIGQDVFTIVEKYETITGQFLARTLKKTVKVDTYTFTPKTIEQSGTIIAFFNDANELVMNSQLLSLTNFERNFLGSESIVQKLVREHAKINIPFNVLRSANLELTDTNTIEQGPAEIFTLSDGSERHFTGAMLLENAGRKFLMDIDRIEIKHGIFNAFFVEVNKDVKTILDAYESMKPAEVISAEAAGVKVLRQGEWFFIETDNEIELSVSNILNNLWSREQAPKTDYLLKSSISHGKGRPNDLHVLHSKDTKLNGLVSGVVSHTGREHKDLVLCKNFLAHKQSNSYDSKPDKTVKVKLWQVIGNTTVSNFQITGDID